MELLSKLGHLWLLDHSLRPVVRIWFLGWSLKPWIIRRSIINQVILSTKLIIVPLELRFVRNRINLEVGGYRWLLWVPWDTKLVLFYQSVIILLIRMSFVQLLLGRVPSDRSWLFFVWIVFDNQKKAKRECQKMTSLKRIVTVGEAGLLFGSPWVLELRFTKSWETSASRFSAHVVPF